MMQPHADLRDANPLGIRQAAAESGRRSPEEIRRTQKEAGEVVRVRVNQSFAVGRLG